MNHLLPAMIDPAQLQIWLIVLGTGLLAAFIVAVIGRALSGRKIPSLPTEASPTPSSDLKKEDSENRVHRRISVKALDIVITSPDSPAILTTGVITDRSLGGLGLEVQQELPVGSHFRLRLQSAEENEPWILLKVRYCRSKGNIWRIGCQFVELSEWDVMQLFGPPDPEE